MRKSKIFSVIICCYNAEKNIDRVISNIMQQELLDNLVCEIIVVDNNSNDETKKVVLNCQKAIPIIRYIFEPKQGLSNARKAGVDACETEWIIFLDDDNFIRPNWIKSAFLYIEKNAQLGVFNGAVIPKLLFPPSKEDILILESSFKVLACTHLNIEDLAKFPISPFRNPIGAGLVIRTNPLKELSTNGWLNSDGRTADNLTSGEDGEMSFFVKSKGYIFGFCPDMILDHEIPEGRIKDIYLGKMWYEIGAGVAIVVRKSTLWKIKRIAYEVLIYCRLIKYKFDNKYKYKYYKQYIDGYHYEINKKL